MGIEVELEQKVGHLLEWRWHELHYIYVLNKCIGIQKRCPWVTVMYSLGSHSLYPP